MADKLKTAFIGSVDEQGYECQGNIADPVGNRIGLYGDK